MKYLVLLLCPLFLTSCAAMTPDMFKTINSIATDDAIVIKVDRDAVKDHTDIHLTLEVKNQPVPAIPVPVPVSLKTR